MINYINKLFKKEEWVVVEEIFVEEPTIDMSQVKEPVMKLKELLEDITKWELIFDEGGARKISLIGTDYCLKDESGCWGPYWALGFSLNQHEHKFIKPDLEKLTKSVMSNYYDKIEQQKRDKIIKMLEGNNPLNNSNYRITT